MKKYLLALLVFLAAGAQAALPSDASLTIGGTRSAFGNMLTRQAGSGIWEVAFQGTGSAMAESAGAVISADGGAGLAVTRSATLLNPAGNPVAVSVAGRMSALEVAGALGRFAKSGLPVIGTGIALYELGKELDMTLNNSSGQMVVTKDNPGWTGADVPGATQTLLNSCNSQYGGCAAKVSYVGSGVSCPGSGQVGPGACIVVRLGNGNGDIAAGTLLRDAVQLPSYATIQDFIDAVAAKSGWPTSSNAPKAVRDALESGQTAKLSNPSVTGPSTSPGKTTTTVNPDSSKTVTTTSFGHTYSGPNVSTVTNSTVNNYDSHDVQTSTSSTTSTPDPEPSKNACETNPDSIGCQELGKAETPDFPTEDSGFSSITPVAFTSNASCPADINFVALGHTYIISYAGACGVANDYLKPILLLLSAGLAAYIFVGGFKA